MLLPYFTNEETETKENKSATQIHSAGVKQNWNFPTSILESTVDPKTTQGLGAPALPAVKILNIT